MRPFRPLAAVPELSLVPSPRRPPAVGVVAAAGDAAALGGAVALALARECRAACVLLVVWTGGGVVAPVLSAPAGRAARRLAANLAVRGHDVCAGGRVVCVALPAPEREAAEAADRAVAAAGAAPTVLVVGGPRGEPFEELLAEQDRVLVATRPDADPALAGLAADELPVGREAVASCPLAPSAPARALARAGLLVPSLRSALRGPLEGLA